MAWLDRLVQAFILTFGITQPSPEGKRLANFFIGGLMLIIVIAFLTIILFGVRGFVQ